MLFESPDFEDAIKAAQNHFKNLGLTEQFIEKDYYVTEALRIVARHYPYEVIFKGGTSLSKGWKLINRFSEDIDLFLDPNAFVPPIKKKKVDENLKRIEELVGEYKGLNLNIEKRFSKRYISRQSYFSYEPRFSGNIIISNQIFLEMGIRSGNYPTETRTISSFLAQFIQETNQSIGAEDESSFPIKILHFRRTFIEKLLLLDSKIKDYLTKQTPIANHVRHYYDIFCLAKEPDVEAMLKSEEYQDIKRDCFQISSKFYDSNYTEEFKLSESLAFFPDTQELRQTLSREYGNQCAILCYGEYPTWEEIESLFLELRDIL